MKLVAVVRPPARPDEAAHALAAATALTLAEARMRLAPEPPALLARLEDGAADALAAALRGAGVAAVAVDARCPGDGDRIAAHRVALGAAGVTFAPRAGAPETFAWPDVLAVLRGMRAARTEVEREEKTRRFSAATAIASGGVMFTHTSRETVRSASEALEQVILVYARDGRAATLADGALDFASCLGPRMQPAAAANMAELARLLREGAPRAFHDDRLLRLGRRPLPFLAAGESRTQRGGTTTTRSDSSGTLDTLAEVLRQAVAARLLP